MADPFAELDACAQAALVRRREVAPIELVEAAIARIERLNPAVNAVIAPLFDSARATARDPRLRGPFRGVPLLLKDFLCETAGDPYCEGLRPARDSDWRSPADTHLARSFRDAGFVILGKTNVPELALSAVTEPAAFGASRNPWNPEHTPGGSSGGSAAAVACGMVAIAHGNDGTGSIRGPASVCGLVGLKPSRGRVSTGPGRGAGLLGNVAEGVLTRTVRDTAATLDAIAGPWPGDLFFAPPLVRPLAREVGVDPGTLRVGVLRHDPFLGAPVHAECGAAVERTARLLMNDGHLVEDAFPDAFTGPTGLGPRHLGVVSASGVAAALDRWGARLGRAIRQDEVEPLVWERAELGRRVTAVELHAAVARIQAGIGRTPEWWARGFDLLLTPTHLAPPPRIGVAAEWTGLFTLPFSFSGQPAISLPVHESSDGLPIGVQLAAAFGREDLLIRVAARLEEQVRWNDRRPRVFGGSG